MKDKLLTISIAAYNVEKYLEKTLKSLICNNDLMQFLQVIVVDDGSCDKTSAIAQKYADMYPQIFLLIKKENGGHGSTMNTALQKANGKYFRMLDGDDWYDTLEFERYLRELKEIDVDCVITPYCQVYDVETKNVDSHKLFEKREYSLLDLMSLYRNDKFSSVRAPELTIKTDILKKNGLHLTEKCMYTDTEYLLFVAIHARTYIKFPYFVYQYRLGNVEQSVGECGRRKYLPDIQKVIFSMLEMIQQKLTFVVNDSHKSFCYDCVINAIDFWCESLWYSAGKVDAEGLFTSFVYNLKVQYIDFMDYFKENNCRFRWWKWLFSLKQVIEHEKCVIFGAGIYGERILKYLMNIGHCQYVMTDNNSDLWNTKKAGCLIITVGQLLSLYGDSKIIIAVKNRPEEIENQLLSMGVAQDRILTFRE